jgi:hypothetical protein
MKRIIVIAVAVALLLPSAALGSSSSCQAYNPQSCTVVTTSNASTATLPFTGLNVGMLVAAGVTLLGSGFAIRRLTRRPD